MKSPKSQPQIQVASPPPRPSSSSSTPAPATPPLFENRISDLEDQLKVRDETVKQLEKELATLKSLHVNETNSLNQTMEGVSNSSHNFSLKSIFLSPLSLSSVLFTLSENQFNSIHDYQMKNKLRENETTINTLNDELKTLTSNLLEMTKDRVSFLCCFKFCSI